MLDLKAEILAHKYTITTIVLHFLVTMLAAVAVVNTISKRSLHAEAHKNGAHYY